MRRRRGRQRVRRGQLRADDVRGEGPEVISLNEPGDGTYRVLVHYCLDRILEPLLRLAHAATPGTSSSPVTAAVMSA